MELITAQSISKGFGGPPVLEAVSLRILKGDSIGLVGANGAGKTTLVKILVGWEAADSGTLDRTAALRVGYVEQVPTIGTAESVRELLLREVEPARRAMEHAEAALAERAESALAAGAESDVKALLSTYQKETERFEALGGYEALDRGITLLSSLGIEADPDQPLATLSGGELSLVTLATALIGRPDLLVLDEPGNHLDYLGLAWLEQFLKGFQGSLLVISHNRYLLDSVCRTIWHLEAGRLTSFTGDYTAFRQEWERRRADREHEFRANDRKARELERRVKELRSIASSQYNPPAQIMSKLGAAKRKLEEAKEARGERPGEERFIDVELGGGRSRADVAISFKGLELTIAGRTLLKGASFHMHCGERVALVGPNGCGKSTLLERIVSEGGWSGGPIRIGPSLKLGYLSQVPRFTHPEATILEEVRSWGPLSVDQALGIVAPFLFSYDDLSKPVGVLSGGEQNRLQFARLVYQGSTLLILDEPTNHMDIPSREAIERALAKYDGTLLVVSHDRYFLNELVERVVEFDGARLVSHDGNFSDFFAARYARLPKISGSVNRRGLERRAAESRRSAVEGTDSRRSSRQAAGAGPTDWEATIHRLESEQRTLESELAALGAEHASRRRLLERRIEMLAERIERAYHSWIDAEG